MKKQQMLAFGLSVLTLASMAGPALAAPRWVDNWRQQANCNDNNYGRYNNARYNQNRWEARRDNQNQRQVNRFVRVAHADGRISPWEARKLAQIQNRNDWGYRRY